MRIYLQTAPNEFRSFVLLKEINPFELLFMPYGLSQQAPTLTVRCPERIVHDMDR